jgi:c-di-GMP-binding flagellar brake protein YcgR
MVAEERRSYLRGDISFKVKFTVIPSEQYGRIKSAKEEDFSSDTILNGIEIAESGRSQAGLIDANLINFLVQMDEKLDQILAMLSKDGIEDGVPTHGMGTNISGSGMNLIVEESIDTGKIIHTKFFLSRFPLVFIDVFGEIVHVMPFEEDGNRMYQLGIKFLNLKLSDRERIIASVFQQHRQSIRKSKGFS